MDEQEYMLIERCRSGDADAFGELATRYEALAYRIAFRMLRDGDDAADIVQEAFLRIWRHRRSLHPRRTFSTWLYRIVINLCLDRLKSAHYRLRLAHHPLPDTPDPAGGPESLLTGKEIQRHIHEAAAALSPVQKSVFVLRDLEGLSIKEVAGILGTGTGAVKTNLYLARKQIRETLESAGYDHE
ncbi:RNA polymerase sigma factor [bacterium]|nr:RNA polymerase sigma factor [bacterium]